MSENEEQSFNEMVDEMRQSFGSYLKAAKSILLGETVSEEDREYVRDCSTDSNWFYQHCVPPYEYIGVEPDEEFAELEKVYEQDDDGGDESVDELEDERQEDDDDGVRFDWCPKAMKEFGIADCNVGDEEFAIAKSIWEGVPLDEDARAWTLDNGVDALIGAKVKTLEDLSHIIELLEKCIESYKGEQKQRKTLLWRLADCYYITDEYDKALAIYRDILLTEKGFVARPTLVCQILNIKVRAGLSVKVQDLMMLPKPSDYKLTINEFKNLLEMSSGFLDVLLEGMVSHGLNLKDILEKSGSGSRPYSCFYRSRNALGILKSLGKDVTFPNIDTESRPLKELLSHLFTEMRFLGNQLKDVAGVEEDWIEETRMFNRLIDVFPHEEIIHHYRTPWLWKFQLSFYLPRMNLAFDFRGRAVREGKNFTRQSGGKDEYFRLYDRTMEKAESKYGIHVEVIDEDTSFETIVAIVRSHGGTQSESSHAEEESQRIICPKCGEELELPFGLVDGQHIRCMACGEKFAYSSRS